MSFIWPPLLLALLVVPLLLGLMLYQQRRRRRLAASYSSLGFGETVTAGGRRAGVRRALPLLLYLLGLTLLLLTLARPQMTVSLPQVEGTVVLAFDVSRSMAADDLDPSRMEAAKAAAREFVQHQPAAIRIGVVAFSGGGFIVQPPTNDQGAILATIERLSPQQGTSLGQGILASLSTIFPAEETAGETVVPSEPLPTPTPVPSGTAAPAVIVLLTDGENNENPNPLDVAREAADRGVRIHTVGIGSPAGATLEIDGFLVHTQLDEATLQQIARVTGGSYYNAQNEADLQAIYENLDPELVIRTEEMEVTSIFAGASILALLIGGLLSLLWFGRVP